MRKKLKKPFDKRIHEIEVVLPARPCPEFELKIDGKKIQGVAGLRITSPLFGDTKYPMVEVRLWAKRVIGEIHGTTEFTQPGERGIDEKNKD